ncbi:diguanylate cyclase (GGDEF) domain-containing protein [Tindallia magadiensis]|uniref:Diguanylate cyclase (GGDEF) domain-containing protein n=1 Tax=Tindallia magadiensis TaxID=69895 RepID=A0A1I3GDX6_9FIRM|nr:diguanylate cyclase [Tindallia magadiensis]SFI21669.1 diguanylate cyclase (GGDEF) domain-containing protein [Tindallia magadiensis]
MQKKFYLMMALLISTILMLIVYNVTLVRNEIIENRYNTLVNDLRGDATAFGLWIHQKKNMINTAKDIYQNFSYEELMDQKTENPYFNINKEDPSISQIYIGLEDGNFLTGGRWVPPEDYDPRSRTWYQEAYKADKTIVSNIYTDRETGEMLVTVSSPFYLEDQLVGVLSADVFLESIRNFLVAEIEQRNSYSYLIDEDGTIVIHTRQPELEGQNIHMIQNAPALTEYFEKAKKTGSLVRMSYEYEAEQIIGIVQKAEGRNWYLVVARVDETALMDAHLTHQWMFLINGIMLLSILMLIYMISKTRAELHNMNELLTKENEKDFLTGIYNRRYLNLYLESLWKREDINQVSILILDVDFFKKYNDFYGHIMGDDVLKKITQCIDDTVREKDVFARFGGEEFALVLENVHESKVKKIAQKIIDTVYRLNIEHETSPFERITISIGAVTVQPSHTLSVREAIDYADEALYDAKEAGRNRVAVYAE